MSLVADVKEVISTQFEEVAASSLCLKLFNCYSKLYLSGGQPRTCTASQLEYYQQLIKNGIQMAELFEEAKNRTCEPNWVGLKYIPGAARHYAHDLLTDAQAIELLKAGHLTEKHFLKLPDGFKKKEGVSLAQKINETKA